MEPYKHYSFDLWLTLIRSNPQFKLERARIFHSRFNTFHKSFEEVATIFRQVDLMVNGINEKTGKNIDADEMYLMVISVINNYQPVFTDIDMEELCAEMDALLFNYQPLLYGGETRELLVRLKESGRSTVSLLSNTGFIKGVALRKVLQNLELDSLLDFQLYSDEVRLSKPNVKFFELMIRTIDRNIHKEIGLHEIVHIGDNPVADIMGAEAAGIKSVLINSNHQTINCLI
ncbi:HAD family hydrolase [Pedobacter sp. AW31-3R]|uniref:HAD family hydrolase n=1 Tax=Pedobacter sp. AW31-3R TaxID=3445781 RepID=UPI003FA0B8D3